MDGFWRAHHCWLLVARERPSEIKKKKKKKKNHKRNGSTQTRRETRKRVYKSRDAESEEIDLASAPLGTAKLQKKTGDCWYGEHAQTN